LGGNKIRAELGDQYVDALFYLYEGRVLAFSDLVCYWFEKARVMIESGQVKRAGYWRLIPFAVGPTEKYWKELKKAVIFSGLNQIGTGFGRGCCSCFNDRL